MYCPRSNVLFAGIFLYCIFGILNRSSQKNPKKYIFSAELHFILLTCEHSFWLDVAPFESLELSFAQRNLALHLHFLFVHFK